MTREDWAERLPLIQAFVEGKTIQYLNSMNEWVTYDDLHFTEEEKNYRIKPEPKVIWVNEYPSGRQIFDSEESARKFAMGQTIVKLAVKYVAVME